MHKRLAILMTVLLIALGSMAVYADDSIWTWPEEWDRAATAADYGITEFKESPYLAEKIYFADM